MVDMRFHRRHTDMERPRHFLVTQPPVHETEYLHLALGQRKSVTGQLTFSSVMDC